MAISKVYLNSDVQMDVTDTTASQSDVASTKYYYGADGVKKQGSYVVPSAVTQATPTISVNTSTGLITASATQSAGVVSAGTKSATEQLSTQAAQTIYPSTSDQTITSGKYLTGAQIIKGVLLTNLSAGNIKKDVVVKVGDSADDDRITSVTGTYEGGGGGVTPAPEKDVNFIDYDGTIVYSYTKSEFASLSAMPANPSHTGLTAQGWNWSLSDAKTYVASNGKLWIGQMYITSSGATEIDIKLEEGRLSPYLGIAVNGEVDVDWGDSSTHSTITGSSLTTQIRTLHEYSAAGEYTIKISVTSGSFAFYGTSTYSVLSKNNSTAALNYVYAAAVRAVRVGGNVDIKDYAFSNCYRLETITLSSAISLIATSAFQNCYNLRSATIPYEVTQVQANAFAYCSCLLNVAIPKSITYIGGTAFDYCTGLQSVTLSDLSGGTSSYAFRNCLALSTVVLSSVTYLRSYHFQYCYSLSDVILGDVPYIQANAFANDYGLSNITIPGTTVDIAASVFSGCRGLGEIHFKPTTPPTVANSNAFSNLPTDCIIYVPYSADHSVLADYKAASNYPNPSTYTYVEET